MRAGVPTFLVGIFATFAIRLSQDETARAVAWLVAGSIIFLITRAWRVLPDWPTVGLLAVVSAMSSLWIVIFRPEAVGGDDWWILFIAEFMLLTGVGAIIKTLSGEPLLRAREPA